MLGKIANHWPLSFEIPLLTNQHPSVANISITFQSTGGHFLDIANIKMEPEERPEDLYQRIVSFVVDSLLKHRGWHHTQRRPCRGRWRAYRYP